MFTVRHYITEDEHDPFQEWLKKLRDPIAKGQVVRRVGRIEAGNFGDHKPAAKVCGSCESTKAPATASITRWRARW